MALAQKIGSLLTEQALLTCTTDKKLSEIVEQMKKRRVGSVVILEGDKPAGIFTERDYLMKVAGLEASSLDKSIGEFMTKNPRSVRSDEKITEVLTIMQKGGFRHLLIVDEEGRFKNIVSVKDLVDYLVKTIKQLEETLASLLHQSSF